MSDWTHKDEWKRTGSNFCVVVSRHESAPDDHCGPNRWCVYAYIYPRHPHFSAFSGSDMWQEAATCLPLHAYPSMLRWHRGNDGEPTSVQVGADYDHLHDERFTLYSRREAAREVFDDADQLFDSLQNMNAREVSK